MSGYRGPGDGRGGPGYGYYGPGGDDVPSATTSSASTASSSPGGSSSLPVWALVLIMMGSGLLTLTVLGLFVLVLCRRRRARRAARRVDVEAQSASERETVRILGRRAGAGAGTEAEAKEVEEHAKQCESEAGVELAYVVMAGEEQPSYLARVVAPITPLPDQATELEKGQPPQSQQPQEMLQPALGPLPTVIVVATSNEPASLENHQPKPPPSPLQESP